MRSRPGQDYELGYGREDWGAKESSLSVRVMIRDRDGSLVFSKVLWTT